MAVFYDHVHIQKWDQTLKVATNWYRFRYKYYYYYYKVARTVQKKECQTNYRSQSMFCVLKWVYALNMELFVSFCLFPTKMHFMFHLFCERTSIMTTITPTANKTLLFQRQPQIHINLSWPSDLSLSNPTWPSIVHRIMKHTESSPFGLLYSKDLVVVNILSDNWSIIIII